MNSITSSCRVSSTGSRITIASVSTSSTRRSSCRRELVHLRHPSNFSKMTSRRRLKPGVTSSGAIPTRAVSHLSRKTSAVHHPIGSKLLVGSLHSEEEREEAAVGLALASSAERPHTWLGNALIPTRPRGGSMVGVAEELAVAAEISQQEGAAEIKR